jgi:hypothetical protein
MRTVLNWQMVGHVSASIRTNYCDLSFGQLAVGCHFGRMYDYRQRQVAVLMEVQFSTMPAQWN